MIGIDEGLIKIPGLPFPWTIGKGSPGTILVDRQTPGGHAANCRYSRCNYIVHRTLANRTGRHPVLVPGLENKVDRVRNRFCLRHRNGVEKGLDNKKGMRRKRPHLEGDDPGLHKNDNHGKSEGSGHMARSRIEPHEVPQPISIPSILRTSSSQRRSA